jgi:hypothetical protein
VTATDFPLSTVAADETGSIAAAPGDNVLFTEDAVQEGGRINPRSQVTEDPTP